MFCDTETHGFYGEVCLFQYVGMKGKAKVKEYPSAKWMRKFVKKYHTVWYNASYDLGTIFYQGGKHIGLDYKFDDLFYAARTAYPELERYSLDILHDYIDADFYDKDLDKRKMQKSFATVASKKARKATEDQIAYAKADVYTLREMWDCTTLQSVISFNDAYSLDINSLKYSLIYQMNGLPVDRENLHKEQQNLVAKIAENKEFLGDINPQSPKQVTEALGTAKSDKATLVRLMANGNRLAEVVFEQRRLLKAAKMLETWDFDRVHTFFNPAGTITGRFSSSGGDVGNGYVNTQQISRQYQYLFRSTSKKRITFEVDYSTAELRAGCSIMKDAAMYEELMEGKDLHIESAKLTGIENPTREDRQKGKAVSFGLIFSMSAKSFKEYAFTNYGVVFSEQEAFAIHKAYHTKYKGIAKYQRWCWNNYEDTPIASAMGRENVCRLGTDASNYATQSTIAEATKWAVHFLVTDYPEALNLIVNVVHDAIYLDTKKKEFKMWSKRLEDVMLRGWKEVCKSPIMHYKDIPMPTEVEVVGA